MFTLNKSQAGFTLVELAIVMMIIGLLIGGVLKGQELIANARVTATIAEVQSFQASALGFLDQYSSLPGDMINATNRVPNCTAATRCLNGDGSGIMGNPTGWRRDSTGAAAPFVETSMFWKHLLLSGYISGVAADADPASPAWGVTHPSAAINGGYQLQHTVSVAGSGHWLRLQNTVAHGGGGETSVVPVDGAGVVSPLRAAQIDRKMDDGNPDAGIVHSWGQNSSSGCGSTGFSAAGQYNETVTQINCYMVFSLGF